MTDVIWDDSLCDLPDFLTNYLVYLGAVDIRVVILSLSEYTKNCFVSMKAATDLGFLVLEN